MWQGVSACSLSGIYLIVMTMQTKRTKTRSPCMFGKFGIETHKHGEKSHYSQKFNCWIEMTKIGISIPP